MSVVICYVSFFYHFYSNKFVLFVNKYDICRNLKFEVMERENIKTKNNIPDKNGYYVCLTKYGDVFCCEILKYEKGCGWMCEGYYFEDQNGEDLMWIDHTDFYMENIHFYDKKKILHFKKFSKDTFLYELRKHEITCISDLIKKCK